MISTREKELEQTLVILAKSSALSIQDIEVINVVLKPKPKMTNKSKEQHIIDVVTHYMNGGDVRYRYGIDLFNIKNDGSLGWDFDNNTYEIVITPREFKVLICDGVICADGACKAGLGCKDAKKVTVVEKL